MVGYDTGGLGLVTQEIPSSLTSPCVYNKELLR